MEKFVIVPQKHLDRLEEARIKFFDRYVDADNTQSLMASQEISEPMWYLTHRKYPIIDLENCHE